MLAYDWYGNIIGDWDESGLVFDSREIVFDSKEELAHFLNCCLNHKREVTFNKISSTYPCFYKFNCICNEYQQIY